MKTGSVIAGTYEVLKQIGSGGGGIVYLANHLRLNKKVVLKADKRTLAAKPEVLRREVDFLKDLSHTYIPQVYDFFVEGETVYTVMDFIEGESLDKPLKRGESFSQARVIKWAGQLLEALVYLHSPIHGYPPRGIVHSDIKPANVMVTPQGDIRLIDFNIALALGEENVVGRSAGYASPEHYGYDFTSGGQTVKGDDKTMTMVGTVGDETESLAIPNSGQSWPSKRVVIPDARSDIYSLGATLYHLLTGIRPPRDASEVEPLSMEECSLPVAAIVNKAMQPNPDLRYQNAEEVLDDFQHLRERDPRWRRLQRQRRIASVLLFILFATGGASSFVGLKQMEATQSALALASYAEQALAAGDRQQALAYALQALPDQNSILVPTYTSQAQKTLAEALGVYDLSDGFKHHKMITLPAETLQMVISPAGQTGAAVYTYGVVVFDVETGVIRADLPAETSALAEIKFVGETLLYAGNKGLTAYDVTAGTELWTGRPATAIAVSGDGQIIAAVYKDDSQVIIYNIDGTEKMVLDLAGRKQWVPAKDTFGNPEDNLLALSRDGSLLAISFADGDLSIFDLTDGEEYELLDESMYFHFEGGFHQQYFAFSATSEDSSLFYIYDMEALLPMGGFTLDSRIGVKAYEHGLYISHADTVVQIHPVTGEQRELAYVDFYVKEFATDSENTVVVTEADEYLFFDQQANLIGQYSSTNSSDFVQLAEDFALVGSRDTPEIHIMKSEIYADAEVLAYQNGYLHSEARMRQDEQRYLLFSIYGFQLYDREGRLLTEVELPDPERIQDQQFCRESGNLAVMYPDVLRIYAGEDGRLLYEETDLQSVFYASHGVSLLALDQTVSLIDLDTAEVRQAAKAEGDFAALCGELVLDRAFLGEGELIGAAQTADQKDYLFVIYEAGKAKLYDGRGTLRWEIAAGLECEVFFTSQAVIISPLHGTPTVYNLKNGKKIADLETDAYLTYVTETDGGIVTQYITAAGEPFGYLLDRGSFQPLAYLPDLADVQGRELFFDYHGRVLRKSRMYLIDELIGLAEEVNETNGGRT